MLRDDSVIWRAGVGRKFKCLVLLGLIFLASFSSAARVEGSSAAISLSPEGGEVGTAVLVGGAGFAPFAGIEIEFGGDQVSSAQADELGEFSAEFEVPEFTTAGSYDVVATDDSENEAISAFEVDNSPPVADEVGPVSVEESAWVVIGMTASDANGDTLTMEIEDTPSHGTLTNFDEDTGEVTYNPEGGYIGPDSFSFKVNDGTLDSNISVIMIDVEAASDGPSGSDIEVSTEEDEQVIIDLQVDDSDSESVSFSIISEPEHGSLGEVSDTGPYSAQVVYTPEPNYSGPDSFEYVVSDGQTDSYAWVLIDITGVNDAPVAIDKTVTVKENSKKKIVLEATDPDEDSLIFSVLSQPNRGQLTGTAPDLFYEPDEDYTGSDSFAFSVSDSVFIRSGTISIEIDSNEYYEDDYYEEEEYYYGESEEEESPGNSGHNTAPVSYSQSVSGTEDTPLAIMLSADDQNGDDLTFSIFDYPSHGAIIEFAESSGELTYVPDPEYSGEDSLTFTASDGFRETKKAKVSITIEPVNDPPRPISMNVSAADGLVNITLIAYDAEGDPLQFSLYGQPSYGVISGEPPEIAYAANPGFAGYDKFLFAVTDGRPETRIGVVSISVGAEDPVGGPDLPDGADDEPDDEETPEEIEDVPGPGQNPPGLKESTTKARADKSNVMVLLDWNHQNKEHGIESTVHLQFAEHRTRTSLESHVWYDLVMLDENNNEIMRKNDLVALDSEDMQKISFPAEGTYHFEVNVKGLIDKSSNEITRNTDYTGKALGTVVVPEFGPAFMLLLAASALAAMMLFARYRRLFDRTFDY